MNRDTRSKQAHPDRNAEPSVARCARGSMLAWGVPIALVLTGVLWRMISISTAVLQAQALRFAADRTAYEVAVWHARGMNIIACLNLLMAGLVAAYAAWNVVLVRIHIADSFCWFSPKICMQADADALKAKADAADPKVWAWVLQQLKNLEDLEKLTSTVAPRIALVEGSRKLDKQLVVHAFSFGASLVSDARMSSLLPAEAGSRRLNASPDLPSLPIEAVPGKNICLQLRPWSKEIAFGIQNGVPAPWLVPFINANPLLFKIDDDVLDQINKIACTINYNVAGLWQGAKDRPDVALQVYGFSFGTPAMARNSEHNVTVLVGTGATTVPPEAYSASQAEYAPNCKSSWAACSSLPLFDPNWFAGLRRLRVAPEIQSASAAVSLSVISAEVGSSPGFVDSILMDSTKFWNRIGKLVH